MVFGVTSEGFDGTEIGSGAVFFDEEGFFCYVCFGPFGIVLVRVGEVGWRRRRRIVASRSSSGRRKGVWWWYTIGYSSGCCGRSFFASHFLEFGL